MDIKVLVATMEVIDGFELLILNAKEKIRLSLVLIFNGKRYRKDECTTQNKIIKNRRLIMSSVAGVT